MRKKKPATAPVPSIGKMGGIYGTSDPMASLFEKYHVQYGNFRALAWAMAGAHEPGFRATKIGRPREIDAELFNVLVEAYTKTPKLTKLSDRAFARELSKKFPTRAPKWEALRKHLPKVRAFAAERRRKLLPELVRVLSAPRG